MISITTIPEWEFIPDDCKHQIFKFFNRDDVLRISAVSKEFLSICQSEEISLAQRRLSSDQLNVLKILYKQLSERSGLGRVSYAFEKKNSMNYYEISSNLPRNLDDFEITFTDIVTLTKDYESIGRKVDSKNGGSCQGSKLPRKWYESYISKIEKSRKYHLTDLSKKKETEHLIDIIDKKLQNSNIETTYEQIYPLIPTCILKGWRWGQNNKLKAAAITLVAFAALFYLAINIHDIINNPLVIQCAKYTTIIFPLAYTAIMSFALLFFTFAAAAASGRQSYDSSQKHAEFLKACFNSIFKVWEIWFDFIQPKDSKSFIH